MQNPLAAPKMPSPEQVRQQHEAWMEKLRRLQESEYGKKVTDGE